MLRDNRGTRVAGPAASAGEDGGGHHGAAGAEPVGLLMTPTSDRGRRTLDGILDAAVAVFGASDGGQRRPSVAAVAAIVDISPAAVYQYFPDRGALVLAAMERDVVRLVRAALDESRAEPFAILTGGFIDASVRLAPEHPLAVRAVATEHRDILSLPLARAAFDRVRDAFLAELVVAQDAGVVRRDADPAVLADSVISALVYTMWSEAIGAGQASPRYQALAGVFGAALFQPVPDLRTPDRLEEFRVLLRTRVADL